MFNNLGIVSFRMTARILNAVESRFLGGSSKRSFNFRAKVHVFPKARAHFYVAINGLAAIRFVRRAQSPSIIHYTIRAIRTLSAFVWQVERELPEFAPEISKRSHQPGSFIKTVNVRRRIPLDSHYAVSG